MHKKSAVLTFIEKERAQGATDQEIQHRLLDAGWHMDIINRAMGKELSTHTPKSPVHNPKKRLTKNQLQIVSVVSVLILLALLALFI